MAKRHEFGTAPDEDDILVIQGKEYPLQPFGMKAFRESLERAREANRLRAMEVGDERTGATYDLSVDLIKNAVQEEYQAAVLEHIERSVGPGLVSTIAAAIMRGLADVDPTQPTSSSDGSSEIGPDSMDGVSPEA